jgi:hypothetical protein
MQDIEDVDDLKAKLPRGGWRISDYDIEATHHYGGRRGMRVLLRLGDHVFWPNFLGTYHRGAKPKVDGVTYGLRKGERAT